AIERRLIGKIGPAEMMGQNLRLRFGKYRKVLLERARDPFMKLLAARAPQAVISDIASQGVPETISRFDGARLRKHETCLRQSCQRRVEFAAVYRHDSGEQ